MHGRVDTMNLILVPYNPALPPVVGPPLMEFAKAVVAIDATIAPGGSKLHPLVLFRVAAGGACKLSRAVVLRGSVNEYHVSCLLRGSADCPFPLDDMVEGYLVFFDEDRISMILARC